MGGISESQKGGARRIMDGITLVGFQRILPVSGLAFTEEALGQSKVLHTGSFLLHLLELMLLKNRGRIRRLRWYANKVKYRVEYLGAVGQEVLVPHLQIPVTVLLTLSGCQEG